MSSEGPGSGDAAGGEGHPDSIEEEVAHDAAGDEDGSDDRGGGIADDAACDEDGSDDHDGGTPDDVVGDEDGSDIDRDERVADDVAAGGVAADDPPPTRGRSLRRKLDDDGGATGSTSPAAESVERAADPDGDIAADPDGDNADGPDSHRVRDATDAFGRRGWLLVAGVVVSTLLIPGVVYLYPTVLADRVPFLAAMLVLPFVPAVVLGLLAVWSITASSRVNRPGDEPE